MSPEAVELDLYIHNDYALWKQHEAIEAMMVKKIVSGIYDPEKAITGWMHLVDRAARSYSRDAGASRNIFDSRMRREVATELERRFYHKHMGMRKKATDFEKNLAFMTGPQGQRIAQRFLKKNIGKCDFCGATDHASDDHSD